MDKHVYRRTVDLDGQDSLAMIGRLIDPGSQVLELGLATGYFSEALVERRGCVVDGVEADAKMAEEARPWVRKLLVGDLETIRLADHFPENYYDAIVCADILEHLRQPEAVLSQLAPLLAENGRIIVSIPNIAYSGALLELFHGDFQYRPEGLLDRTHLRFYTLRSFTRLTDEQGLRLDRVERVHYRYEESEFRQHLGEQVPEPVLNHLLHRKDADVYQYILTLRPVAEREESTAAEVAPPPIDIVIPVYKGDAQTRRCLGSVLKHPQVQPFEVIVIDDASPQQDLKDYLNQLGTEGRITLISNPRNLGFPRSANIGMGLHPDRDVVVLNSDTEVYGDWLDRLHRAAYSSPKIGTVTPFSNNATICSYPRYCQENLVPKDWHPAMLDRLCAEVNSERYIEIPTAVGCCMYITRAGLEKTGYFDVVSFGRGYGEENDLCMRLHTYGFKHLLCGDTFVFHQGSVSFGEEKQALLLHGQKELELLHPHYNNLVRQHIAKDPERPLRRRLDIARIDRSVRRRVLFITHSWGGGTERHVQELAAMLDSAGMEVFVLRPAGKGIVMLDWAAPGEEFQLYFRLSSDFSGLVDSLKRLRISRIHVHHLIHQDPRIWDLPQLLGVPYDFTTHDYYSICPQITLTRSDGTYCGEPDESGCQVCLAERPAPDNLGIGEWRSRFGRFLGGAERVFSPSNDASKRILRYFPETNVVCLPHADPALPSDSETMASQEIRVVMLGRISEPKGANQIVACARDAKVRNLPITFVVIGDLGIHAAEYPELPLFITGIYRDPDLDELLLHQRPDLVYFPAQWPETYSYTLSCAMRTHRPVVAPRLGAFEERLRDYPQAVLIDWDLPPQAVNDLFLQITRDRRGLPSEPAAIVLETQQLATTAQGGTENDH